ncbi:hypothetical protein [Acaryochloris thomasi]|nr:hypothetical protein [Acaryochloris thomasi]
MDLTFLIQKAGDREWLPLESPTVEVLEGRYHLIAHATQLDQPLDIQIRHRYENNGVLQEERQQHRQKPDVHGNLSLLPDAYLGHGLWTLTCTFLADQTNEYSQSINLQVLAEDCDAISDWEFVEATQNSWPQVQEIDATVMSEIANQINAEKNFVATGATKNVGSQAADCDLIDVADIVQSDMEEKSNVSFSIDYCEASLVDTHHFPAMEIDEVSEHQDLDAVSLPVLPRQKQTIQCQPSQGTTLPPQLSAHQITEQDKRPLDLPAFPRDVHWRYIPLNKLSVGMHHRQLIHQAHCNDIEQAFTALELQQRFWRTMHQLIDPRAAQTNSEPVSVFTRTAD